MAAYYEIIIRGDDRDLVPFVSGFAAASGMTGIHFAREAGLRLQPLRERIKHRGEVQHVVCDERQRAKLHQALAAAAPRYKFEVLEEARIERAAFHFEFDTPSREVAAEIRKVLAALPAGVALRDYSPQEVVDPTAKGSEVYSPAHEYVFRGRGVIEGELAGVFEMRKRLAAVEFVRRGEIDLERG